jgi:4,5-dihydroxyphthalate decarboxylase
MSMQPNGGLMKLASQRFDRSAPLFARTVAMPGIQTIHVPPGSPGVEGVQQPGFFDAAEMPLARYVFLKDQGDALSAVPVFPDRLMVHQYVYTRTDSGIESMADLRGKRVLLTGYWVTASFWHRTILEEEYGVPMSEVHWHVTGPELDPRQTYPPGVEVTVAPGPFQGMEVLLDGRVDALMSESTPPIPLDQRHLVKRVIPDAQAVQREWYRRTGFNPIVHLVVVRKDALERWPDFGYELCSAYDEAMRQTYLALQNERFTSLPFMRAYLDDAMEIGGDNPWPYGVERNRAEIERFLTMAHEQGMTRRRVGFDELFDARSLDYAFTARLEPGSTTDGGSVPNAYR